MAESVNLDCCPGGDMRDCIMTTQTHAATPGWSHTLSTEADLREYYREPSVLVKNKSIGHLDEHCRDFIAQSTFVVIGTTDGTKIDVSPKGGPAGFVKVLDGNRLAIPDLNGNNRLDGLRDLVTAPEIGLLFVIAGMGETLRVSGTAVVTVDPDVLDLFTDDVRRPKAAIGVTVEASFLHCAKAFMRGDLWKPETWSSKDSRPSPGAMLVAHAEIADVTSDQVDESLAAGYQDELAEDHPE